MAKKRDYNLIVIGAGSAGLVTSYLAAALKARVLLIERHRMGGDCLNTGCVPSKALLRTAKFLAEARDANKFGLERVEVTYSFSKVMERVQETILKVAPHDSVERYQSLGVECLSAEAQIVGPHEVRADGKVFSANHIVIATGARPLVPPIHGLADVSYRTSDTIWQLRERPESMAILGGGPIGCELAQAFSRLGVKVHLIEGSQRILPREEKFASDLVYASLIKDGVTMHLNAMAQSVQKNGNRIQINCKTGDDLQVVESEELLVALGRKANTAGFGLETLGVNLNKNGTVSHNEFMQTSIPSIYVCGDVAGPYQFTHTAAHQAWYAAVNTLFGPFKRFKVDYRVIPWATFTDPEVARVGITKTQAEQENLNCEVSEFDIGDLDRALADSHGPGHIEVITPKGKDTILGATIVSQHASDLLPEFVLAMKHNLGLNKILGTIHVYPTMSEANKYVAGAWRKQNQPQWLMGVLHKFHEWRR